jgi:hypothetical protein
MEQETRTAILAAIDAGEERLRSQADGLRARSDARLRDGDGDWSVRDTLCHLAARANDIPLIRQYVDRDPTFDAPTMEETNAANAGQIAARTGRSVDELLSEAYQGYAAARATVAELDDAWLQRHVPEIPGFGPLTAADLLLMVYRDHVEWHIGTIERALTAN